MSKDDDSAKSYASVWDNKLWVPYLTVWREAQNLVGNRTGYPSVSQMPDLALATSEHSGKLVKCIGSWFYSILPESKHPEKGPGNLHFPQSLQLGLLDSCVHISHGHRGPSRGQNTGQHALPILSWPWGNVHLPPCPWTTLGHELVRSFEGKKLLIESLNFELTKYLPKRLFFFWNWHDWRTFNWQV